MIIEIEDMITLKMEIIKIEEMTDLEETTMVLTSKEEKEETRMEIKIGKITEIIMEMVTTSLIIKETKMVIITIIKDMVTVL